MGKVNPLGILPPKGIHRRRKLLLWPSASLLNDKDKDEEEMGEELWQE